MLGPSLLEMLHDLVFMEMLKLVLFSVIVFFSSECSGSVLCDE